MEAHTQAMSGKSDKIQWNCEEVEKLMAEYIELEAERKLSGVRQYILAAPEQIFSSCNSIVCNNVHIIELSPACQHRSYHSALHPKHGPELEVVLWSDCLRHTLPGCRPHIRLPLIVPRHQHLHQHLSDHEIPQKWECHSRLLYLTRSW